jgi:hypothetical protein
MKDWRLSELPIPELLREYPDGSGTIVFISNFLKTRWWVRSGWSAVDLRIPRCVAMA